MKKILILFAFCLCCFGLTACEYEGDPAKPEHVHLYTSQLSITAPNCTKEGNITVYCLCGESKVIKEYSALGHNYVDFVVNPTCETGGYTKHTCVICGDVLIDNYTDKIEHVESEPVIENTVDATCVSNGSYDLVTYCEICNLELKRDTIVVEKTYHNYDVDENKIEKVESNLYKITLVCDVCGDEIKVDAIKTKTIDGNCSNEGYDVYKFYYMNNDTLKEGFIFLDFTDITNEHTLGYIDEEEIKFEAYNMSNDGPKYSRTELEEKISPFIGNELKFNGGNTNSHIATFECVHCHKLIVIYLGE